MFNWMLLELKKISFYLFQFMTQINANDIDHSEGNRKRQSIELHVYIPKVNESLIMRMWGK